MDPDIAAHAHCHAGADIDPIQAGLHAARLDVGPSAMVSFRLGEAQSRVAVDYRLRVAGDAAPASGPALTFSAGF